MKTKMQIAYLITCIAEMLQVGVLYYFFAQVWQQSESGIDFTVLLNDNQMVLVAILGGFFGIIGLKLTIINAFFLFSHLLEDKK